MKFDLKSTMIGIAIGILCTSSISIASDNPNIQKVENAFINNSKVFFYKQEIPMKNTLIEVVNTKDSTSQLYMPLDDILEYMHFKVEWTQDTDTVNLTMNTNPINSTNIIDNTPSEQPATELDSYAIELMTTTGNWRYVEPYFAELSNSAIQRIVSIYNSKHPNVSEHKDADQYLHD